VGAEAERAPGVLGEHSEGADPRAGIIGAAADHGPSIFGLRSERIGAQGLERSCCGFDRDPLGEVPRAGLGGALERAERGVPGGIEAGAATDRFRAAREAPPGVGGV